MTSTEELERLLAEATPGPWYFHDLRAQKEWEGEQSYSISVGLYFVDDAKYYPSSPNFADAALIVAAVNALPELLERVKRLEEALKPFADEADKWANCIDKDAQEILIAHPIDVTVDSYGEIDGLNDAAFTLGDLRRARAALKETGQ